MLFSILTKAWVSIVQVGLILAARRLNMEREAATASQREPSRHDELRPRTEIRLLELPYVRSPPPFSKYPSLIAVDDIMTAILPEEDQDELPVGFNIVGHVGMPPLI